MSLPEFSVRRPVTVLMATLAVTLFGFISAGLLPIELLPDLAYPTLTVRCVYPDAAPVSVEQFVSRPIEEGVGVIPGVRDMRSISRAGLSEVILEFEWDEPMDFAAMEVREKLGLVELPLEAETPRVLRFDPSLDPILRLAFSGEDRPLDELRQVAERWLKPRLEAVAGVAAAKVRGGLDPEIVVEADEDRLAALGLTLGDLAEALRAENVNRPGGTLKDWGAVYLVRTLHEFDDLEQLRRTVVRENPDGRVRVEDVATVGRGHRDREEITRSAGVETVEIALHREGSANTIAVARAVRDELDKLREEMRTDLSISVLTDQSIYIAQAVGQVRSAALLGGLLAVVVLYFFLRDPRATSIIAVTIPISVTAAFLPMYRAGVSLNIMSLGGLALGVGMLVDNSIVVLEAIDRHRRAGASRREAARRGGGEVAGAVTAATLTTVCVFLPIVFVQGVAGQLFYDLAVTVCLSLIASLFVSLTLIPALASLEPAGLRRESAIHVLGWDRETQDGAALPGTRRVGPLVFLPLGHGRSKTSRTATTIGFPLRLLFRGAVLAPLLLFRGVAWLVTAVVAAVWWALSRVFHGVAWPLSRSVDLLAAIYPPNLSRALVWRWPILVLAFVLFGLALAGLPLLGTRLVPDLNQGEFAFRLRLAEGTTLENTAEVVQQIEDRLAAGTRFARVFSTIGSIPSSASGRQTSGEQLAQINFVLPDGADPADERAAITRVRAVMDLFPAVEAEVVYPSVLSVRPPVAVNVFSDDLDLLDQVTRDVEQRLRSLPGLQDVATTSEPGNPEITIQIDRDRAAALGVAADSVSASLRRKIRGDRVGQFREQEERLDIRLRASETSRDRAEVVETLRIRLPGGAMVPVSAVAKVSIGRGPAAIHRIGGGRVSQVTAKVSAADLGQALQRAGAAIAAMPLPPGAVVELAGQDEELRVSFNSLKLALALAVFLVYAVMAMQFESFKHPFVILLSLPLGIVGVVAALLATDTAVGVLVLIGAVMLAGIVVNNAIVLVDAINRRRRNGEALEAAIVEGGRERLRPILMTTATTVLALLPMAVGLGAGDELRRPMAITVIGGLSAATLLTLVVIPCLYRVLSRSRSSTGATTP